MTTFNTGWVLASGQEINWTTTTLSDSTTVALLRDDKTFDNYINAKEMVDGKAYYYYSSWQENGSYLYLKSGSQYYKGLLADGADKFKREDIKKRDTSANSSSSGSSNYKTEVERTERLEVKLTNTFERIKKEIKKDDAINISTFNEISNSIVRIKQARKRWATGTRGFFLTNENENIHGTSSPRQYLALKLSNMGITFTPRYIIVKIKNGYNPDIILGYYAGEYNHFSTTRTTSEVIINHFEDHDTIYTGIGPYYSRYTAEWIAFE